MRKQGCESFFFAGSYRKGNDEGFWFVQDHDKDDDQVLDKEQHNGLGNSFRFCKGNSKDDDQDNS